LLPAGANRRVGLAPTGKRRLVTAHTQSSRSPGETLAARDANISRITGSIGGRLTLNPLAGSDGLNALFRCFPSIRHLKTLLGR
jgi:hypothetical protein